MIRKISQRYYPETITFSRLVRRSFLSRVLLFFSISNIIFLSFNYFSNTRKAPALSLNFTNFDQLFVSPNTSPYSVSNNLIKIESEILAQEELEKRDPLILVDGEYGSNYSNLPPKIAAQAIPLLKHLRLKKNELFKLYYQSGQVKLIKSGKKFVVSNRSDLYDHSGLQLNYKQPSRAPITLVTSSGKSARISSGYGYRIHPIFRDYRFHPGIDVAAPIGSKVHCAFNGRVTKVGYSNTYGTHITIQHEDSVSTLYAHLDSVNVKIGDFISQGSIIGKVGKSGRTRGAHLHFEVRRDNKHVNPTSIKAVSIRMENKSTLKKMVETFVNE